MAGAEGEDGVHQVGVRLGKLWDVADPYVFVAEWEVWEGDGEEVVEELHVVQGELSCHG